MPFFNYHQNNSGGGWNIDEAAGISVNVIIEADDATQADIIAQRIGIYFDGCDTGRDCSCCGDRWYSAYGNGDPVPSLAGHEVKPGDPYPAADDPRAGFTKWTEEGVPDGFIHFKDGRVEGFHATTAERKDLDGSFGWGVRFYPTWDGPQVYMVTSTGYDETGNAGQAPSGPSPKKEKGDLFALREWVKPEKATVQVERLFGRGGDGILNAWFPTEDEAQALADTISKAQERIKQAIRDTLEQIVADDELRGDIPKRQFRSIVNLWKP